MIAPTTLLLATTSPPLGLPAWAPWALIALGAVMLVVWWSGSRKGAAPSQGSSVLGRLRAARATDRRSAADALPPESGELVDLLCARLDERAARIEALLAEAKGAIARLEALRAGGESPPPRAERVRHPSRADRSPVVEVMAREPAPAERPDPLCESVYALADSGADAVTIAKQLDEHVGKVQLILALRAG